MDIHRVNGIFVALERKCTPACHCICKSTGFGVDREVCSRCSKPIDYMQFDNETLLESTCTFARGDGSNIKSQSIFFVIILISINLKLALYEV